MVSQNDPGSNTVLALPLAEDGESRAAATAEPAAGHNDVGLSDGRRTTATVWVQYSARR